MTSRSSMSLFTTPKLLLGNQSDSRPGKYGMEMALLKSPFALPPIGTVMRDPMGRTRTPTLRRHEISATLSPRNNSFSSPNRLAPMPIEMRCVAVAL